MNVVIFKIIFAIYYSLGTRDKRSKAEHLLLQGRKKDGDGRLTKHLAIEVQ